MEKPPNCPGEYDPDNEVCASCFSQDQCIRLNPNSFAVFMEAAREKARENTNPRREETIEDFMDLVRDFYEIAEARLGKSTLLLKSMEENFFDFFSAYLQVFGLLKGQGPPPPKGPGIKQLLEHGIPDSMPEMMPEVVGDELRENPEPKKKPWWMRKVPCPACGETVKLAREAHFWKAYCTNDDAAGKRCKWAYTLPDPEMQEYVLKYALEEEEDGEDPDAGTG